MAPSAPNRKGLLKVAPTDGATDQTTIDIIAIHGLGTESPRTWEFKRKDDGRVINWLCDNDMLPAAIPEARIFTYDWNANYFENAPVQMLLGHADNLLAHVIGEQGSTSRPIIFIASCFGGLVLAEAINQAAQEGSSHRRVLLDVAGVVFLATPFRGSDGAKQAGWQVVVGGIMGHQTSTQLIEDLHSKDKELRKLTQSFATLAHRDTIRIPVYCFYETEKTEMLRRLFAPDLANRVSTLLRRRTKKILVTEESACLDGVERQPLNATHSGMNKFNGPGDANYSLVKGVIRKLADDAADVIDRRKTGIQHRHFVVPFGRNDNFVGRDAILEQLLERVSPSAKKDDCQRTAIEGLGGIGKTQIALEAAYQVRDTYPDCSVFWVPAVDMTSFDNAYRQIGQLLQLSGINDDKVDVKVLVKTGLSYKNVGSWLLIIDNADDLDLLFQDAKLADYLPFSRKGSILLTTRNHQIAVRLDISQENSIAVPKMDDAEAAQLLRMGLRETQISDTKATRRLLNFFTNLPLAIKQASAFMVSNTNVTVSQYLEFCESSNSDLIDLLSRQFEDRHRYKGHAKEQNPIATTWLISFEHISRYNPQAADCLKFACLLAEKDIPLALLPTMSNIKMVEAVGTLKAYAFIIERNTSDSFDIHRLVRLVMRSWLQGKGEWEEWTANVVQRLTEEYPFPKHENRKTWTKYLPHGQAVLEIDGAIDSSGDTDLLFNVAESYSMLGKYSEAEQLYWQILGLREEALGKEHPDTLISMNNLAVVLDNQGKYEEAEKMHRQKLKLSEQVLGKEHPDILTSMSNLALVLNHQGKYEEAEKMHRQELGLKEEVLGKEHPDTLTSMNNLAIVLNNQGKYKEAEKIHRQKLKLSEQVQGKEHPDTLISMNNLAVVLHDQGKYKEAEKMHRQELELSKQVRGKKHPNTLTSMNNLAVVLNKQGKYKEAEKIHRQELELREEVLSKKHPYTLISMNNLASVLDSQGKYEEAEKIHRQILGLREEVLGKKHPATLSSMNNLAFVLQNQEMYEEAEELHRQGLELYKEVLGKKHPATLSSMNNLALVLQNQEIYEEAEELHRQGLELREEVLGKKHPDTFTSIENLVDVLRSQGKNEEAEMLASTLT